jgi:hypothetical protein
MVVLPSPLSDDGADAHDRISQRQRPGADDNRMNFADVSHQFQ